MKKNAPKNMILVNAISRVWEIMLLIKVICFTREEYNTMKIFLVEMSDQTREIRLYIVAFFNKAYCKQNKKVNESNIDNYVERMQQVLISDRIKADFKNIIFSHAVIMENSTKMILGDLVILFVTKPSFFEL